MMTSLRGTIAAAAVCSHLSGGSAALADVTANDVWADWRGYMVDAGYAIRATETQSGGTLAISDLQMTITVPDEDATVEMTMGDMSFTENGDGTVSIVLPSDLPIGLRVDGPDAEQVDIGLNYGTRGLSITVSGDPDDMSYTYSAASVAVTLEELTANGEEINLADFGTARIEIANIAGSTRMTTGDLRRSVQKLTTGAVEYLIDFRDPEGGDGRFVMRGGSDAMDFRGTLSLPSEMDTNNVAAMLGAGFAFDGRFAFDNGASDLNFQDDEEAFESSSRSDAVELRMTMDNDQLVYALDASGIGISMAGADIPFPIDMAMEKTGFNVTMPVTAGEEPRGFELGATLGDFTMSDMIWGIFDPAGELPRDPATVAFDVSGAVRLFSDLLDPAQMEAIESGEAVPGEIDALDINSLTVRAAGAELTGTGEFTFDNSDLTTFDGMPAPSGEMNLRLVGGNSLLDKLVAMGAMPEDEASGMRMMMGLMAVPGDGEDTLTSRIEVQGDGKIIANGQRIR